VLELTTYQQLFHLKIDQIFYFMQGFL